MTKLDTQKLFLTEELLLAKGGERLCYLHPDDSSKVVKIAPDKTGSRDQNNLDMHYHTVLMRKNKSLEYLTECFGFVETNLGQGLVFSRVLNYDGTASHSLKYIIYHKMISADVLRQMLNDLLSYLRKNQILFSDIGCGNLFCQQVSEEKYVLIIVDGLGGRRVGYKYWLYTNIGFYRRYKIIKQGIKMLHNLEHNLRKAQTKDPKEVIFYK